MREVLITARYELTVCVDLREIYEDLHDQYDDLPDNLVAFEDWLLDHEDVLTEYCDAMDAELETIDSHYMGDFKPGDYPVPLDPEEDEYGLYRRVPRHPDQIGFDLAWKEG